MKPRGFDVNEILPCLVLFFALGCLSGSVHAEPRKQDKRPTQTRLLQVADVFRGGLPQGLIQFDVPNTRDQAQTATPRLAVLDDSGLHIYKLKGSKRSELVQDFALTQPPPNTGAQPWDTLEAFPSHYALPGVVLWASTDVSYSIGTVICYVEGEPQVVFRGQFFDFAHITPDDVPQILVEQGLGFEGTGTAKSVIVWAWNGRHYVKADEVPVNHLYSHDVVKAILAAQRQRQATSLGMGRGVHREISQAQKEGWYRKK